MWDADHDGYIKDMFGRRNIQVMKYFTERYIYLSDVQTWFN